jgi:hypothetical protein
MTVSASLSQHPASRSSTAIRSLVSRTGQEPLHGSFTPRFSVRDLISFFVDMISCFAFALRTLSVSSHFGSCPASRAICGAFRPSGFQLALVTVPAKRHNRPYQIELVTLDSCLKRKNLLRPSARRRPHQTAMETLYR